MPRLRSRERFIPGGFQYYQPESAWRSPPNASFETIVQALIQHRNANPHLIQTHGWSIDPNTVRDQLDEYNARICKLNGWTEFYYDGGAETASPKALPQQQTGLVGKLAAGAEILIEWLGEDGIPAPKEIAEKRAAVCATCTFNSRLDFSSWFVAKVSEAIRRQIGRKLEMKLETANDDNLGTCTLCECPLRLKVFSPLDLILKHQPADVEEKLPDWCWIKRKDQ